MRASLMVRAGSVATAAVIAAGGALATASAAGASTTHVRKVPTQLSAVKHHAAIRHHHFTVITGRLRSHHHPLRGKIVFLDRKVAPHKWVKVRREVTSRFGAVAFAVNPKAEARYVLVFKGSPNFQSSRSRVLVVRHVS
jgi:hypothetical protein